MFFKKNLENKLKAPIAGLKESNENELKSRTKKINMGHDKDKLNFPMENDCFNADDMSDKAKEAKKYLKDLLNPDILEQNKKRWDISVLPNQKEFKTTLFEV